MPHAPDKGTDNGHVHCYWYQEDLALEFGRFRINMRDVNMLFLEIFNKVEIDIRHFLERGWW